MSAMPIEPPFIPAPYQRVGVEPEVPMQDMEILEPPATPEPAPAPVVVVARSAPKPAAPAPKPRTPIKRTAPPVKGEEPTLSRADLAYKSNAVKQYLETLNATERQQVLNELRKP